MLIKNEIAALNLSPTKKDFVQIWNELLEIAGKLSERWDPTSTNESDPGIVILKALTGIADKLNYNIDKNTLEAFMPTAAQEDSMRKLCDMLGYNIKYYRSAETTVTIKYYNAEPESGEENAMSPPGLLIPKFTVITNSDQDINYFTTNQIPYYISSAAPSLSLKCMEGQIVKCESTSDNNVITASQISESNRFYMPEAQIAENGIFVYNVAASTEDGTPWEKVDNLNIQARGSRVFKFGYDSYEGRPYIEFPEDYSELINDGLFIYYARTSGANGNISAGTLTQLELPSGENWSKVSVESFSVENAFSATSGSNIETIGQAYNNFKKTVGTFETLVTCRDYMNKIYQMVDDETGKYLVSNALVTDIRTDLNRAVTICSCDDAGIFYKDVPLATPVIRTLKKAGSSELVEVQDEEPAIDHFDLVLYPFKSYNQIRSNVRDIQEVYDSSFKYSSQSFNDVKSKLDESGLKTIAHNIKSPRERDIISINNYLKLNAIIGTNAKITTEEGTILIEIIKVALANAFNMRELDFGEEIPFDSIVEVIEKADARIKVVSLAEPALYTTFSVLDGYDEYENPIIREYAVASEWLDADEAAATGRFDYTDLHTFNTLEAKKIYNNLAVRNVLAGRVPLFKYNNTFKTSFSEGAYRATRKLAENDLPDKLQPAAEGEAPNPFTPTSDNPFTIYTLDDKVYTGQWISVDGVGQAIYTETSVPEEKYKNNIVTKDATGNNFVEITTSCTIPADTGSAISDVVLADGEFIKFRAPNFTTDKTYPAYVNYYLDLGKNTVTEGEYATAYDLNSLLNPADLDLADMRRERVLSYFKAIGLCKTFKMTQKVAKKDSTNEEEFIKNPSVIEIEKNAATILSESSFVKITSKEAKLQWNVPEGVNPPTDSVPVQIPELPLENNSSFIISPATFDEIKTYVDNQLIAQKDNLPTNYDWTLSYEFEYVPFEAATLAAWANFITTHGESLFDFKPVGEHGIALWRAYGGDYDKGKYILKDSTSKLMPFTSRHFELLTESSPRIAGIYIVEDLGRDLQANFISNNEEYMLKTGERLFIEYTPSTTTEGGSSSTTESIKEVLGEGTIIKPGGFANGLMDSSEYATAGSTPHKTVTFELPGGGSQEIGLHSLGASEQIEIRDFARVVIDKDKFPDTSTIYVYKNFNNCPELETIPTDGSGYEDGKRINSSYTLKDGEYIFYTDQNKAELAYFTSGTEVTLTGNIVLPKFDKIDLATIFDNGMQEIPWKSIQLSNNNDGIIFQEFQYITLGSGDTLNTLQFKEVSSGLNSQWQQCTEATYTPAGAAKKSRLPKINISDEVNGWEVCSILELNVSPSHAQTLRRTDKIETKITLHKDTINDEDPFELTASEGYPLSLKANLPCQSSSGQLKISDIYLNPNNLKSFELKVFTEETPAIIKTMKGKLLPYQGTTAAEYIDITKWPIEYTEKPLVLNEFGATWQSVKLTDLISEESNYDKALKLTTSILPATYGIFSVYIDYHNFDTADTCTWLELLPGSLQKNITLFNAESEWLDDTKLKLNSGINCIRVNKTSDIFIKTNSQDGVLYFDNIRLVDCQQIEYIKDDETVTQTTQGLNLDQIGYLDTTDKTGIDTDTDTFNVFDMRIRKRLKDEFTNRALADLDALAQNEQKESTSQWKELQSSASKLQTLVSFIKTAKNEIERLLQNDADDYEYKTESNLADLFANYNELCENLNQEEALKAALDSNKDINDLEQQLVDLLESFTSPGDSQQELLKELDALEKSAIEKLATFDKNKMSKGDILDDFEAVADAASIQLVNDLKLASIIEINSNYAAQLATLKLAIEELDNSDIQDKLLNILDNLNAAKHAKLAAQIKTLISINQESLNAAINDALELAKGTEADGGRMVNYLDLAASLITLRDRLNSVTINELVSQFDSIFDSSMINPDKYNSLSTLVEELKVLLDSDSPAIAGNYASLVAAVNSILTQVQAKPDSSAPDSAITTAIAELSSETTKAYITQLENILGEINTTLTSLESEASTKIGELTDDEEAVADAILGALTSYSEARGEQVTKVDSFNFIIEEVYSELPYGTSVVLTVWPDYMKRSFITGVDKLYKDIRAAISGPEMAATTLSVDSSFKTREGSYRQVLVTEADLAAFQELFERAKDQIFKNKQNFRRKELINNLGELILATPALSSAMNALSNEVDDRNAILRQIIKELQEQPAISKKTQLIQTLKKELTTVIDIDTQLVTISANLLCPSILLFDSKLPKNDEFYTKLRKFISDSRADLLSLETDADNLLFYESLDEILIGLRNALETDDALLAAFNENDLKKFTKWDNLLATASVNTTLLDDLNFIPKLATIKQALDIQDQIANVKECTLLKLLRKEDLVVAWQVGDRWLDSAGNYYIQKGEGESKWQDASGKEVKVDVYRTSSGTWQYSSTNSEVELKDGDKWLRDADSIIVGEQVSTILDKLLADTSTLGQTVIPSELKDAYSVIILEDQLLDEIRAIDKNRNFYYNVPVESNFAIDFNEGKASFNTLMNPAINYDINNVNNNFVISKIDINYLTDGLKIARSSKFN